MSTQGEIGMAAAGSGRPCCRARSWVVMTSPPPEESPVKAMWAGSVPWSSSHR
jgi:hypothetical protein